MHDRINSSKAKNSEKNIYKSDRHILIVVKFWSFVFKATTKLMRRNPFHQIKSCFFFGRPRSRGIQEL